MNMMGNSTIRPIIRLNRLYLFIFFLSLFLITGQCSAKPKISVGIKRDFQIKGIEQEKVYKIIGESLNDWDILMDETDFIYDPYPDILFISEPLDSPRIGEFRGFPHISGKIVISSSHTWTERDLKAVVLHEIFHFLSGQTHSDDPKSVIYPQAISTKISEKDIKRLRSNGY